MTLQKFRWSKVYESSEEELTTLLEKRKITAERIAAETSDIPVSQTHDKDSTVWCAEGSLAVRTDNNTTALQPGDALQIPANTVYELRPGITGYVCYKTA
ncbi:hypothetical protein BH09PAT3_BH09PAT3_6000 [soil metagenome]